MRFIKTTNRVNCVSSKEICEKCPYGNIKSKGCLMTNFNDMLLRLEEDERFASTVATKSDVKRSFGD